MNKNRLLANETAFDSSGTQYVRRDGEQFFKIENSHRMPEFFMTLAGSSDHWMFVSSYGAVTAGRKNPDLALFPYYSSDKLSDLRPSTGPFTQFLVSNGQARAWWQPFLGNADLSREIQRNLYKNALGTRLIFEEVNFELGLSFSYQWSFGHQFGIVRSCSLDNFGMEDCEIRMIDGIRNIIPFGLPQDFQLRFSNLGDAYKKHELLERSGIGLFYLSSIPSDRAEPSEGLRTTTVWQHGLTDPTILLSDDQIPRFRAGHTLETERDVRGRRGSFLLRTDLTLSAGGSKKWHQIANVGCDQVDVSNLEQQVLGQPQLIEQVLQDTQTCHEKLFSIVNGADAQQCGANQRRIDRHRANVLFNVMRGGTPIDGYTISRDLFGDHVLAFNAPLFKRCKSMLAELPETLTLIELIQKLTDFGDQDLLRLGVEFLPLTFGRRHGDPTRPWNRFSIATPSDDGQPTLDYQGNWRDIFQNWEALACSYPRYLDGMVLRFLNATTADGHNPYRLTKNGFDWEVPDPDDPWANIGYWSDHQIIYLLKLLEWSKKFQPKKLAEGLGEAIGVFADVPYRIAGYDRILADPCSTIDYDVPQAREIEKRVEAIGNDGQLLHGADGKPVRATVAEKLLVPLLAKIVNFVPGGGIWLNTQRPEWNDANNALVGQGLSVVTVCHMRRYFDFLAELFSDSTIGDVEVSEELCQLFEALGKVLTELRGSDGVTNRQRMEFVDRLQTAGEQYRNEVYDRGFSGKKTRLNIADCVTFFENGRAVMEAAIRQNKREDGMYHSYNLMHVSQKDGQREMAIGHLYEMLEGQVAVLNSKCLSPQDAVEVLNALRNSDMYREDQESYTLYPDRALPRLMDKNLVDAESINEIPLLRAMLDRGDHGIIRQGHSGELRFNGDFRNASDLNAKLDTLSKSPVFGEMVQSDRTLVLALYEKTFQHRFFTGRSGTFFGYEGLGSIYWHMVSKLVLAISENYEWAVESGADGATLDCIAEHYKITRDGTGFEKTPNRYGAFPTDPYSHTPKQSGAQQPGMTGQVKEDILARFAELGVRVDEGKVQFTPQLLGRSEFLTQPSELVYESLGNEKCRLPLKAGSFAFTFCQVPVVYVRSATPGIHVHHDGTVNQREGFDLTIEESNSLFDREGTITRIDVMIPFE